MVNHIQSTDLSPSVTQMFSIVGMMCHSRISLQVCSSYGWCTVKSGNWKLRSVITIKFKMETVYMNASEKMQLQDWKWWQSNTKQFLSYTYQIPASIIKREMTLRPGAPPAGQGRYFCVCLIKSYVGLRNTLLWFFFLLKIYDDFPLLTVPAGVDHGCIKRTV